MGNILWHVRETFFCSIIAWKVGREEKIPYTQLQWMFGMVFPGRGREIDKSLTDPVGMQKLFSISETKVFFGLCIKPTTRAIASNLERKLPPEVHLHEIITKSFLTWACKVKKSKRVGKSFSTQFINFWTFCFVLWKTNNRSQFCTRATELPVSYLPPRYRIMYQLDKSTLALLGNQKLLWECNKDVLVSAHAYFD